MRIILPTIMALASCVGGNGHQRDKGEPLLWRALAVSGTCVDRPELTLRYLAPILAEVEAAAAAGDPTFIRALADMLFARDRTLGSTGGGGR